MADAKKPTNGANKPAPAPAAAATEAVLRMVGQYVKDLSFENPNVEKRLAETSDAPQIQISINVNAVRMKDTLYESAIELKAAAATPDGTTFYDLEILYAGLFHIENMSEAALEQILLVNAPGLIFPFVRRLALDLTREGGFPPLQLDPVDWGALFLQRQQQVDGEKSKMLS